MKKRFAANASFQKQVEQGGEKEFKKQIALQMKIEGLAADVTKGAPEPTQKAIEELYNQSKERFKTPEQIRVSHVVKHISGLTDSSLAWVQIQKAKEELAKGMIFEDVVARFSDCRDSGGDLGWITCGMMVEEFEDVAFNLGPGEVSDIFQTRYGYHIVKLYDRKPATIAPLKEVRDILVRQLSEQIKKELLDNFLDELKKTAKIEGM
jgi:peptidyl-prolyl cis-trans isomerase C